MFLVWNVRTEDGILAVVGVGLFGGVDLVEFEDIVDESLFAG